jgi:hypothetical protein
MLTIYHHNTKTRHCFHTRSLYKVTASCPAPCCDVDCEECADEGRCPHSEHGKDGGCVVQIKPGTGIWQFEPSAFNDDDQRAEALKDLPAYEENGQKRIADGDLPHSANMACWRLVEAEFECLAYFSGSCDIQSCACVGEEDCCCADWIKEKERIARPDAPRRKAGRQRAAMLVAAQPTEAAHEEEKKKHEVTL